MPGDHRRRVPWAKETWRAGTVEISGGRLALHRTPARGPAVVLAHGLTDSGLCCARLAAALEQDFEVIMIDARGHGESSRMPVGDPADPADDVREALAGLGLEQPFLIGHSVGARAMAEYAAAQPGQARALVLEDPPLRQVALGEARSAFQVGFRNEVEAFGRQSLAEIEALGRKRHPTWPADEFAAWAEAKHAVDPRALVFPTREWRAAIAAIEAPTLLVHGERELGSLAAARADEAAALNPQVRAVEIKGAGHNVRRENFEGYLAAVRDFLDDQARPGRPIHSSTRA